MMRSSNYIQAGNTTSGDGIITQDTPKTEFSDIDPAIGITMLVLDTSICLSFTVLLFYLFVRKSATKETGEVKRVKIDFRSKVIIFIYYLSTLFSCVNWIVYIFKMTKFFNGNIKPDKTYTLYAELIDVATVEMVQIILQFIVFEMYSLYVTLTSMSREENDSRQRCVSIFKYLITISTVVSIIGSITFLFFLSNRCLDQGIFCYKEGYETEIWVTYAYRLST